MLCATQTLMHQNLHDHQFINKIKWFNYSNEVDEVEKENRATLIKDNQLVRI